MIADRYQVHVGNVGMVHSGNEKDQAIHEFADWSMLARAKYGRAAGESVVLFEDGEPIRETKETL